MDEVRTISARTSPHYTFLVIDAMTGQDAVQTAKRFHDALDLDGVIVTKLDSDARGGVALSVRTVVGRPIVFASVGETPRRTSTCSTPIAWRAGSSAWATCSR